MADGDAKTLATAILELARKAAHTWDYDGEQMIGEGVSLTDGTRLREIAGIGDDSAAADR